MFRVASDLPGTIYIMEKPEPAQLHYLCGLGVSEVVSLLSAPEIARFALADEADQCDRLGLTFSHLPVEDYDVPDAAEFAELAVPILEQLQKGASVALHCRAGIGRSGMAACCLLTRFGRPAVEAMQEVSAARGVQVPETTAQREFVIRYAQAGG